MSAAPKLATRRALVTFLKADAPLIAVLPAARIFGEKAASNVQWPYLRLDEFESGQDPIHIINCNVHLHSKADFSDEINQLCELAEEALDGAVLTLEDGSRANVDVNSSRILRDGAERSWWHGIISIEVRVPKDCTLA